MISKHLGVRYVYEEEKQAVGSRQQGAERTALTPDALAVLPSDVFDGFEQAVEQVNPKMIAGAIEAIQPHNASLANALARLADEFHYDQILRYIQEAKENKA